MNLKGQNIKNFPRQFIAIAAVLFVLLSSCPVKLGIKVLAGIPIKTEKSHVNKTSFYSSASETCAKSTETGLATHTSDFSLADLLPVAVITAIVVFFFRLIPDKEETHPLYNSLKIPGTVPIFLQYRKLII